MFLGLDIGLDIPGIAVGSAAVVVRTTSMDPVAGHAAVDDDLYSSHHLTISKTYFHLLVDVR